MREIFNVLCDLIFQDAHNCCPDYDPDKNGSLFAVYDGHGGEFGV